MNSRSAFTLIELLVVIAIIAILAAILFPVFAQAKAAAKKITSVSNLKQIATAVHIYISDYDDVLPITYAPNPANPAQYNHGVLNPAGSWYTPTNALTRAAFESSWATNTYPYTKNYQLLYDSNSVPVAVTSSPYPGAVPPSSAPNISYTYNGNLNGYSHTAVTAPSQLPVLWNGRGRASLTGWAFANPPMFCYDTTQVCSYRPPTPGCPINSGNGNSSFLSLNSRNLGYDLHMGGIIFTYADSHAKWVKIGVYSTGNTNRLKDPFASYNGTNQPVSRWSDQYQCHSYLFRPDFDFGNEPGVIE
ncbi:MAG: prepilin-type N-terminal cleavage/methylation domain-containing protein [Armatimonadetes bacterium]|nr:prepilin-type N-terminal cleavage/methylation domain-containing protein [Armatimonadota bacterium]